MLTIKKTSIPMGSQRRIRKQKIKALITAFVETLVGALLIGAVWAMVLFALLSPCGATIVDADGSRTVYQCSLWSQP